VELAVQPLEAVVAAGARQGVHLPGLLQRAAAVWLILRGEHRGVKREHVGLVGGLEQLDGGVVTVGDPGLVEDEVGVRGVLEKDAETVAVLRLVVRRTCHRGTPSRANLAQKLPPQGKIPLPPPLCWPPEGRERVGKIRRHLVAALAAGSRLSTPPPRSARPCLECSSSLSQSAPPSTSLLPDGSLAPGLSEELSCDAPCWRSS